MCILDTHDLIATVVNLLKVSWWCEVKGVLQPIIGGIKLNEMLDSAKWFKRNNIVP